MSASAGPGAHGSPCDVPDTQAGMPPLTMPKKTSPTAGDLVWRPLDGRSAPRPLRIGQRE